jgi:uncharacterized integral membrane protein
VSAARWLPAVGVTLVAAWFVVLNRGETVVVNLGVVRFYQVPLTMAVFLAFMAGMISMFLLGLRHDLRLRRQMRERGLLGDEIPRVVPRDRTAAVPDTPAFDFPSTSGDDLAR